MKEWLRHFFIPHSGNDYHPHLLHTKRAALYGSVFVAMKAIVIAFVLLVPLEVYVLPDVLAEQEKTLYTLTNTVRTENGVPELQYDFRLHKSSIAKATDMAASSYFAHTSSDGRGLASWLVDAGYPYSVAGENLAIGFTDPRALVLAWAKSPTHFANLIDSEFDDTGISLATGEYEGVHVVYAVQHFGAQKQGGEASEDILSEQPRTFVPEKNDIALPPPETTFGDVLGTKEETEEITTDIVVEDVEGVSVIVVKENEEADAIPFLDMERSLVQYEEVSEDRIRITAFAGINVPFESAAVRIGSRQIVLGDADAYGVVRGDIVVDESAESYFLAVLMPELRISLTDGTIIIEPLRWKSIPEVSLTPVEQYTASKSLLGSITSLFDITNGLYFFFIVFFSIALLVNIFWELHTQHHHITVQTLGLILLLITLVVI